VQVTSEVTTTSC